MAGIDLRELPLDRALNVITTLAVDDHIPLWSAETRKGLEIYDRRRVRAELLDSLSKQRVAPRPAAETSSWNRDTWGLLPEHQASMRAAMAFVGGLT